MDSHTRQRESTSDMSRRGAQGFKVRKSEKEKKLWKKAIGPEKRRKEPQKRTDRTQRGPAWG